VLGEFLREGEKEWFKAAAARRKAVSEEEYADLWRCLRDWMENDVKTSDTPCYNLLTLGKLYTSLKGAKDLTLIKKLSGKRYENVLKNYIFEDVLIRDNPLIRVPLLERFTKNMSIYELEKFQNSFKKPV